MKIALILVICVAAVACQRVARNRDQLRTESARLRAEAAAELRRLEAAGTIGLGGEVRRIETEIQVIERQLEHLDPVLDASRIVTLDHTLATLEAQLAADLARRPRAGVFFAPPRTRDQLRAEAARLRELSAAELRRLEAAGTVGLGTEVRRLETEIQAVERQLEHLDPVLDASRIVTLDHTLATLEAQLSADLARRPHTGVFFAPPRTRDQLRAEATRLRELSAAELRRLEAAGTIGLGGEVRRLETEIQAVERQLEHLDPVLDASRIVTLDHTLATLEAQLSADLARRPHVV